MITDEMRGQTNQGEFEGMTTKLREVLKKLEVLDSRLVAVENHSRERREKEGAIAEENGGGYVRGKVNRTYGVGVSEKPMGAREREQIVQLEKLCEENSYFAYVDSFVSIVSQLDLSEEDQVTRFVEGLKKDSTGLIKVLNPKTLEQAIAFGKVLTSEEDPDKTKGKAWQREVKEPQVSNEVQEEGLQNLECAETEYRSLQWHKIGADDFELLTVIGNDAVGEEGLCPAKNTKEICAMKKQKKSEWFTCGEVEHVGSGKNSLIEVDNRGIVQPYYFVHHSENLNLIIEYLYGGDNMTLWMREDILSEDVARFYTAEGFLAVHSIHQLDGSEVANQINVLLATTETDIPNQALPRSGRIEMKVAFPSPNEEFRLDVPKLHARGMKLARRRVWTRQGKGFEALYGYSPPIHTIHNKGTIIHSKVETILYKGKFTLKEHHDEEETMQGCQTLNNFQIIFWCESGQVLQLLRHILEEVPPDVEKRHSFQVPFITREILTDEVNIILRTWAVDEESMNLLFPFLKLNSVWSVQPTSYVSTGVVCLPRQKMASLMISFQACPMIVKHLVDLIGTKFVVEVLMRRMGDDEHIYKNHTGATHWIKDTDILEMMVDKCRSSEFLKGRVNAEILGAIARIDFPEMAEVLINVGSQAMEKGLVYLKIAPRTSSLSCEYPYNNLLHHHIESIIITCWENKIVVPTDEILGYRELFGGIQEVKNNAYLSARSEKTTPSADGRSPSRVETIVHLSRIGNTFDQMVDSSIEIQKFLQRINKWTYCHTNVLLKQNTMVNVYQWVHERPTSPQNRTRDSDVGDYQGRNYYVAALAKFLNQAFSYGNYSQDKSEETHGSLRIEDDLLVARTVALIYYEMQGSIRVEICLHSDQNSDPKPVSWKYLFVLQTKCPNYTLEDKGVSKGGVLMRGIQEARRKATDEVKSQRRGGSYQGQLAVKRAREEVAIGMTGYRKSGC